MKPLEKGKLSQVFKDVATDPAVMFSVGDLVMATAVAETTGIVANALMAATTIGARAYGSLTGRPMGLGYYTLGAVNALTGASVLAKGVEAHGAASTLTVFNEAARQTLEVASAYFVFAVGCFLGGHHEARQKKPKGPVSDIQTWFALGSGLITKGNPVASALFAGSLAKSLWKKPAEDSAMPGVKGFFARHATPARLSGLGFVAGGIMALANPVVAAAYGLWAAAYGLMDKDRNKDLLPDLRKAAHREEPGLKAA